MADVLSQSEVESLLAALDPDFLELFKVAADFEDELERGPGHEMAYARLVATLARSEAMRPFDRSAVIRVIERAARLAVENPYYNPRPVEYAAIRQLLELAYRGDRPQ